MPEQTEASGGSGLTQVSYVNFWTKGRAQLDAVVREACAEVTIVDAEQADSVFATAAPDVVLVGFGAGTRKAATFIANYTSSSWFRKVPVIALVEAKDEGQLWLCMEWGCDDAMLKPIVAAHLRARIRLWAMRGRMRDKERREADRAIRYSQRAADFAEIIVPLGVAMMAETDFDILLETILAEARRFCNADGGTLYLLTEHDALEFKIMVNASMGIAYGGTGKDPLPFEPIPLRRDDTGGEKHIASQVAVTGETINVADVYQEDRFDFSGAREFDRKTGYRTRSLLTIALRDKEGRVIGVLQLINATEGDSGEVVAFDEMHQTFIESLSRLAGQALDSYRKMARLRRQASVLTIIIDEEEKANQVDAIVSSDYFKRLKARAGALRGSQQPVETVTSS